MFTVLDMSRRRMVQTANYNSHNPGEKHYDRVMQVHDLLCILEGAWEICQDGINYILHKGDVIFLHVGRHHCGGEYAPGVRTLFIHLESLPDDKLVQNEEEITTSPDSLAIPVVVRAGDHSSFIHLFEKIIFAFWSDTPQKNIKLSLLMDELLFRLAESSYATTPIHDSMIENALYYIHITPDHFLKLDELASKLHVSIKSLTQRFKAAMKKTVHEYQVNLKLDMAFMLIQEDPQRPLKDIAQNMGFYDEFHFSRHFKRRFGYSPLSLKKNTRKQRFWDIDSSAF